MTLFKAKRHVHLQALTYNMIRWHRHRKRQLTHRTVWMLP